MEDLLKVVGCLLCLNFGGVVGMHSDIQNSDQCLKHYKVSTAMNAIAVQGSFLLIPRENLPALYLVSRERIEAFGIPEGVSMLNLKSLLLRKGLNEVSFGSLESTEDAESSAGMGETMDFSDDYSSKGTLEPVKDVELPEGMKAAMDFFSGRNLEMPNDEESLFFLKSLLSLVEEDGEPLIDEVDDKLSEYNSYYKVDPYTESSKRLHNIGIYEYSKMFTEECFEDLQIVLEFSNLAKARNAGCARDFEVFSHVLQVIVETVKENAANAKLLRKFENLYEKVVEESGLK